MSNKKEESDEREISRSDESEYKCCEKSADKISEERRV